MAIMVMDMKNKFFLSLCLFSFTPLLSYAGEWTLSPKINIAEKYSDNIELSQENKKSSLISQADLSLDASYKGNNADFSLKSTNSYAWYSHDHDLDKDFYTLSADTRILLWPNGIAFIADANIRNESRNRARNALDDITYADTVQTENYKVGFDYNINNKHHKTNAITTFNTTKSEDGFGERNSTIFRLNSRNGTAVRYTFWEFNSSYQESKNDNNNTKQHQVDLKLGLITDYKFTPFIRYYDEQNRGNISMNSFNTRSYGVGLRWLIIPRLYIDLSYNEPINDESDDDNDTPNNQQQERYADVLINWQPTSRTQIQASHSQRFFGDSYGLNITHKNRRLTNTVSYTEQVQSFTRENYEIITSTFLCQVPNATTLADCFLQPGQILSPGESSTITINSLALIDDSDYWVNKNLRWSSDLSFKRTKFTLNVTNAHRENLIKDIENQTSSIAATAKRTLSQNTSIGLSASYNEIIFNKSTENEQQDKYRRYGINLTEKINKEFNIFVNAEHIKRISNISNFNYSENRVALRLSKDF